jgi:hypothetical protein
MPRNLFYLFLKVRRIFIAAEFAGGLLKPQRINPSMRKMAMHWRTAEGPERGRNAL